MKEKAVFNGVEHEIEIQPLTIIFNTTHEESSYPERTIITPEDTLSYFYLMKEVNVFEEAFFRTVITDFTENFDKNILEKSNIAVKHLLGLISLSLKYILEGKKFGWKYPESFLHPKYQGNLADLLIILNNTELFVKFIENIKNGRLVGCQNVHDKFFKVICCENLKNFVK